METTQNFGQIGKQAQDKKHIYIQYTQTHKTLSYLNIFIMFYLKKKKKKKQQQQEK